MGDKKLRKWLSAQHRSIHYHYGITTGIHNLTSIGAGDFESIRFSLLTAWMAKPNPIGLVWRKKATFFT